MVESVEQVALGFGLHFLLFNRSQLTHSVDPQILVIKHVGLLLMFQFPHERPHEIVITLLLLAVAELQLHWSHVPVEVDGVPVHALEEECQEGDSSVCLHIHHDVDNVQALDFALQVLLANFVVELCFFGAYEFLHLRQGYHATSNSLFHCIDDPCAIVLDDLDQQWNDLSKLLYVLPKSESDSTA